MNSLAEWVKSIRNFVKPGFFTGGPYVSKPRTNVTYSKSAKRCRKAGIRVVHRDLGFTNFIEHGYVFAPYIPVPR